MEPRFRLAVLVATIVVVGVLVLVSPAATPDSGDVHEPTRTDAEATFVHPAPNSTAQVWPYTSPTRSFDRAELPINVVIRADAATVRRILRANGSVRWNATENEWDEPAPAVDRDDPIGIEWRPGHGANRYTYVRTDDGGRWAAQTYQLRDGSYFGTQYHLRLYDPADGEGSWTAVQAHHEHWDWFRLRHTVDSVSDAQRRVERDLVAKGLHRSISRERYANGGAVDADGWVTVVDLGSVPQSRTGATAGGPPSPANASLLGLSVLGAALAVGGRLDPGRSGWVDRLARHHVALFASTAALMPLVRATGITVEQAMPAVSPFVVGAPFFLLLVLGYPALAVLFGRHLRSEDAFAAAALGMGTGIMLDYAYIGVTVLPYDAIVHRLVLLFGLGLIAAGGTRWAADPLVRHRYRLVGVAVWVGTILVPLLGV